MLKIGIYAFIGIALFVIAAECDEDNSVLENSQKLINNFPKYLEQAFIEEEEEEQLKLNGSARFLERHQCFKDYLKIFWGIARRQMWAVKGMKERRELELYYA